MRFDHRRAIATAEIHGREANPNKNESSVSLGQRHVHLHIIATGRSDLKYSVIAFVAAIASRTLPAFALATATILYMSFLL
jgi:hypothetical protein